MRIALLHRHYDETHLADVIEEMNTLGAPTIKAVWMECYGHWAALEGCHRLRAAEILGLTPEIEEIDFEACEETQSEELVDIECDLTIGRIADESYRSHVIEFAE